jgi:hypothetical protein
MLFSSQKVFFSVFRNSGPAKMAVLQDSDRLSLSSDFSCQSKVTVGGALHWHRLTAQYSILIFPYLHHEL